MLYGISELPGEFLVEKASPSYRRMVVPIGDSNPGPVTGRGSWRRGGEYVTS